MLKFYSPQKDSPFLILIVLSTSFFSLNLPTTRVLTRHYIDMNIHSIICSLLQCKIMYKIQSHGPRLMVTVFPLICKIKKRFWIFHQDFTLLQRLKLNLFGKCL